MKRKKLEATKNTVIEKDAKNNMDGACKQRTRKMVTKNIYS